MVQRRRIARRKRCPHRLFALNYRGCARLRSFANGGITTCCRSRRQLEHGSRRLSKHQLLPALFWHASAALSGSLFARREFSDRRHRHLEHDHQHDRRESEWRGAYRAATEKVFGSQNRENGMIAADMKSSQTRQVSENSSDFEPRCSRIKTRR